MSAPAARPGPRCARRAGPSARPARAAALVLLAAAACHDSPVASPAPFDHFFFPTGMAVRSFPADAQHPNPRTQLLVVSSNSDLRYQSGTLLVVDPDASGDARLGDKHLAVLGGVPIESFGGELQVADATNCPALALPAGAQGLAVTTSRSAITAYLVQLNQDGSLVCGPDCAVPLDQGLGDPYGVAVACRDFGPSQDATSAFFTYLRTPGLLGWVTELDLGPGHAQVARYVQPGEIHSAAYDAATGRLFLSEHFPFASSWGLRWMELTDPNYTTTGVVFDNVLRDSLTRGIAISSDGTRAYVALTLYDTYTYATTGTLITQGAGLAVFDITEDAAGLTPATLLRVVPVDSGASVVKIVPRAGLRDLVAVTCSDTGSLFLYDDEREEVTGVIGLDQDTGLPLLGLQPFGMAVEPLDASRCQTTAGAPCVRIFVGAFQDGPVTIVEVDPLHPSQAQIVKRIGANQE